MPHALRLLAIAAFAASTAARADLPTYRVDPLGSDLQGFGMNERGDVVGRKVLSGNLGHAFVATVGGSVEILPVPPEWTGSDAYAINDNGVIVGAVSTVGIATIGSRAAAWYPTPKGYEFVLLGALPTHTYSTALGINNLGDIVGGSGGIGLGMYSNAAFFTGQGVVDLPGISTPVDVNDSRIAVAGNTRFDLGTMTADTIPLPPGNWQGMVAADINNVGGICGYVAGFSGCSTFPVTFMPSIGWTFVGGCATTTSATSINDQGDTLTYVYMGGVNAVFVDVGAVDVGSLIDPGSGNWLVTGLSIINNNRQILGSGKALPDTTSQLIRLTPIVTGDLNGDLAVDAQDLALFLGLWGMPGGDGDFDASGTVDASDLSILLGAWTG